MNYFTISSHLLPPIFNPPLIILILCYYIIIIVVIFPLLLFIGMQQISTSVSYIMNSVRLTVHYTDGLAIQLTSVALNFRPAQLMDDCLYQHLQ